MTQKSPSKILLLHSIENNRTTCQKAKSTTQNTGISTDQIEFNRDIGTNTPNYAEQMAKALDDGNAAEEIVQMLMQSIDFEKFKRIDSIFGILDEPSESYWKLMTERRKQAIGETFLENQQVDLIKLISNLFFCF
jgi:ABC-type microcin C transport system permease subunit YejB